MKKKIIAGICIVLGIAIMVVPFYYHFHGQQETDKLMEQFEQSLEDDEDESEEEVADVSEEGASISEEDAALLSEQEVIGIIEIETLDLKYPIVEGADSKSIAYAIGHMSETAGIGEKGNCVLCGHNGSRNGTFFTNLNQISIGDEVKIFDKKGDWHRYEVKETFIIGPRDNSVKNQSGEEILTLLTCANSGTQRFICVCTPIKAGETDD